MVIYYISFKTFLLYKSDRYITKHLQYLKEKKNNKKKQLPISFNCQFFEEKKLNNDCIENILISVYIYIKKIGAHLDIQILIIFEISNSNNQLLLS